MVAPVTVTEQCLRHVAPLRWRLDQSERDMWHWRVSVRGVRVSVRGQACMDPCQSLAIMRRLVECKKTIIPPDL
ncbi:hypothetical protein Tco_0119933, partial [Tanacetum coccineum]